MGAVILETPRLTLRPWRESDAPRLYELCRDPAIGPAAGWPVHRSEAESLEILRTVLSGPGLWCVTRKGSDLPLGSVGLKVTNAVAEDEPELGYWLGRPWWGRGYIPEACQAVLERCFTALGARRVWCGYYEGNEKSRRVMEKCGFVPMFSRTERAALLNEERVCHYCALTVQRWRTMREERL